MAKKPPTRKTVETLRHDADKRKNIPTAEHESVMDAEQRKPKELRYPRNTDLDPQLVWRGKDEQDWSDLVVHAPPLFIQEKVAPKTLIDDLLRQSNADRMAREVLERAEKGMFGPQLDLFADFNGMPVGADKTDFYQHDQNWTNRMILGDSLQVMASLAEREGLRGKVQCIYLDPPYGIKFNSNFQWSTTSRDVKDGNAGHITREPEQVKAFRDTWRDGIHSYLTYLRDRLTVARDLLTESGSIFVQIGDENLHRVRGVLDEVFGPDNHVVTINLKKKGNQKGQLLESITDYILFYAKNTDSLKYRKIYRDRPSNDAGYLSDQLTSGGLRTNQNYGYETRGKAFRPAKGNCWKILQPGMKRVEMADRLLVGPGQIRFKKLDSDFGRVLVTNNWDEFGGAVESVYVVQTSPSVIQRCLLMATDPGDLVLDPTCGSGTTAYVAEQWGRRWITIDTSRVALALARARIMGARYPFYLLADSKEGQAKEAEVTRRSSTGSLQAPSTQPTHGNIRHGFVYERVPHITLKSIANNAEIDVIWEKWQKVLEPLREKLNAALKKGWQEWEIPREPANDWPPSTTSLHKDWWTARIARQKEIDASIAAKAEFEFLYDKPYDDKRKVRVAGPFTVESLSPHRTLGVDENDDLIDPAKARSSNEGDGQSFIQMILENLKVAGVQQARKEDKIAFTALSPWPGDLVCAEGRYLEGDPSAASTSSGQPGSGQAKEKRAAIFIGPEFGTVQRADLVATAREAGDAGFDVVIACAFNYEAHASEFSKLGRVPVLKARMNADLHMADDLKNTGKGNLFVIFGEPDVVVDGGEWIVDSKGGWVARYDLFKRLSGLGSLEEINRAGSKNPGVFAAISKGGTLRADVADSAGGGVDPSEHRRGSRAQRDGGIHAVPGNRPGIGGGGGNAADPVRAVRISAVTGDAGPSGGSDDHSKDAFRADEIAALQKLTGASFPLSTIHDQFRVTIRGVDVFDPSNGEVRSDSADGIACWFIDTDYNEESFFVRQAYFLGANDPYSALKTTLKAEVNAEAWASLNSDTSRPFPKPASGRIAVKVINHLGDEVMKVFKV